MTQDELKQRVAQAAMDYVNRHIAEGAMIGVGTGSTTNYFIDALAAHASRYRGAVSSSMATTARLQKHGIRVFDLNDIETLPVYIDGADEIDASGAMIKGGGGALTREKIVASVAEVFICIADASKRVDVLGSFALPIEVAPMARSVISRRVRTLGATPVLRCTQAGSPYVTDNGNEIIDVQGLAMTDPKVFETLINGWPGVVTVGLFAHRGADICLLGTAEGVETIVF